MVCQFTPFPAKLISLFAAGIGGTLPVYSTWQPQMLSICPTVARVGDCWLAWP